MSKEQKRRHQLNWVKTVSKFGFLDILLKAVMFATGIFIVRHMDKVEYGWYTIVFSMIGGLNILSNMGLQSGLMTMGGKCHDDPEALGRVWKTAQRYRIFLGCIAAPVIVGTMVYLLYTNECPPAYIAVLVIIVLVNMVIEINVNLARGVLALAGRFNINQVMSLVMAILRFGIIALFSLLLLNTSVVLLVSSLLLLVGFHFVLLPNATRHVDIHQPPDKQIRRNFRNIALNDTPNAIASFIEPQIQIFLIGTFAGVASVADLGAISRIVLLFSIPLALNPVIFVPMLARAPDLNKLRKQFISMTGFALLVALAAFGVIWFSTDLLLLLLGDKYSHMGTELRFLSAITCIVYFTETCGNVIRAKSWMKYFWAKPFGAIAVQACAIPLFDLTTVVGVLKINLCGALYAFAFTWVLILRGFAGKGSVISEAPVGDNGGEQADDGADEPESTDSKTN